MRKKLYFWGLILTIIGLPGTVLAIDYLELNIDFNRELITTEMQGIKYTPNCVEECHLPIKISYFGTGFLGLGSPDTIQLSKEEIQHRFIKVNEDNIRVTDIRILQGNKWVSLTEATISKNTDFYIDIIGHRTGSRKEKSTDIIPNVLGIEFIELAWWNSTWEFFPELTNESIVNFENKECTDNMTIINASEELPDSFWNITKISDLLIADKDNEKVYYTHEVFNFSTEEQYRELTLIKINQCLDTKNITIVYGMQT